MNRLIIGTGSGRCGTHSLAELFDSQENIVAFHEMKPVMPWKFSRKHFHERVARLGLMDGIICDVALYHSAYLSHFIRKWPSTRVIVLQRDKEMTVASFNMAFIAKDYFRDDEETPMDWKAAFPTYSKDESKWSATQKYYEDYYNRIAELVKRYPKNIRIFDTNCLNTEAGVEAILDFAGIKDRNIITGIQKHKMGVWNGDEG
jgi:hypothetical protein